MAAADLVTGKSRPDTTLSHTELKNDFSRLDKEENKRAQLHSIMVFSTNPLYTLFS
jgi:hypothetical protein